ncbi:MAG: endonuclease domain-containing protein [Candidatus Cloacimonetes bacterium]|nr:endonuclease domain-containing protein [Candidatus Cloacimonadota bacterium]MCF7813361.1 endonuclease domain-containing protein [Candidatus Cloacimonadota bacterium]MCF7867850.1 endonuclease domain-containing protein [Candidatus Cloacimonadota bacterium]MCF7883264.1 endonuclease domain-containing protein [Candidatus Cloacimonadota bacterium]
MRIYNKIVHKEKRRELRKKQTPAENKLWNEIRNKKTGFMFYRQYSVDKYILDFYCPSVKLAIEFDGPYHKDIEQKEYDKIRTELLNDLKIEVIRFTNQTVITNIEEVLNSIKNHAAKLLQS